MSGPKPSYLGLLNAIAVAETAAEPLFLAWADKTKDAKLARTLRFVGMREGEHGKAFAKRMLELGYEVREPSKPGPAGDAAASNMSDIEKFAVLGFGRGSGDTDVFDNMFQDKTIDPATGALLGRYIAEERDSIRMLAAENDRLVARAKKGAVKKSGAKKSSGKKRAGKK